jgi:hypothetical protein
MMNAETGLLASRNITSWKRYAFIAAVCIFFWLYFSVSNLSGWDEGFYWAQLTSVFYDYDLTLHNDLLANHGSLDIQLRSITLLNADGGLPNSFSAGTLVFDGLYAGPIVSFERLVGSPRIGNVFIGLVGLFAIFKICIMIFSLAWLAKRYCATGHSRYISVLAVFVGTPVFFYAMRVYAMSHLNSALLATLFVASLIVWLGDPDSLSSLALGLCAGLLAVTRWQDVIYVLLVIPPLCNRLWHATAEERWKYAKHSAFVVVLALAIMSLQLVAWEKQFGAFLCMPQGEGYMHWDAPRWMALLFSGHHGLLPWSPIVAISVVGMIKGTIANRGTWRWFMVGSIITFLAAVYVNSCPTDWWGGWSYGARRFCCLIPIFTLGTFEVFRSIDRRLSISLFVLVLVWAHFTTTCFENGIDDLCVPLVQRRSQAAMGIRDAHWITESGTAQDIIRKNIYKVGHSPVRLFRITDMRSVDRALSLGCIIALVLLANRLLVLYQDNRKARQIALSAMAVYIVLLFFAMCGLPESAKLNAVWKRYLHGDISSEQVLKANIPREPVCLVEALSYLSRGNTNSAEIILREIDHEDYPNLRIEAVVALKQHSD